MGLIAAAKEKIVGCVAADLAHKAENGDFGKIVQTAYVKTKGYKTTIGVLVLAVQAALVEFTPPGYQQSLKSLAMVTSVLTAASLLDKFRRKEPIFEPWFLETLGRITLAVTGLSGGAAWLTSNGVIELWFPGNPGLSDTILAFTSGLAAATGLLNRMVAASAAQPKPVETNE